MALKVLQAPNHNQFLRFQVRRHDHGAALVGFPPKDDCMTRKFCLEEENSRPAESDLTEIVQQQHRVGQTEPVRIQTSRQRARASNRPKAVDQMDS